MTPRRAFAVTSAVSMALVTARCTSLADRYEVLANFEMSTDKEQVWAAKREQEVRAAIKDNAYDLTFLTCGAVVIQFGTGRDRWHWVFEDDELVRELSADELKLAEQRLHEPEGGE